MSKLAATRLLFCVTLALLPWWASGQDETELPQKWGLPGSPTGRMGAALLEAISQSDEDYTRRFIQESFAPKFLQHASLTDHLEHFRRMRETAGDFEVVGAKKAGPHAAELAILSRTSGDRFRISYEIEPEPPHRLTNASFDRDRPSAPFKTLEELDRSLQEQAAADEFSGVVLIAKDWEPIFERAYGYADRGKKSPNNVETKFNVGSINKSFTGVAVMQLAEKGLLELDDPLSKYRQDFPREVADKITIRHLLQHRSGWGHYWENEYFLANKDELRTVEDYMVFLKEVPLDFEPGTQQQYSNAGYEVLGGVVEAVTGQSYYDYMRKHVFEPAGMTETDSYETDKAVDNLAIGYTRQRDLGDAGVDAELRENTGNKPVKGTPAGGGYSTASDLLRFNRALISHRLLGPRHTAMLLDDFNDVEAVPEKHTAAGGFGGGAPGINATYEFDYASGNFAIVLANLDPPAAEDVGIQIMSVIERLDRAAAPSEISEGAVTGDLGAAVDDYMSRLEALGLAGALLVARSGEIVLAKGYGRANRSRDLPNTVDTVFSFGSVTKQFTGAGILKLEMQEKLSVQDRITNYFESVPEDKSEITLHQLLTHSSGLSPYLGDSDFEAVSREEIIQRALTSELLYPPGEGYRYSNVGYSLLAAIIEMVSGQSYDQYLRENLFLPAGMSKTGYLLPKWPKDELAHGYLGDEDVGTMLDRDLAADGPYWNLRGNGGIQSTVADMYRWHLALDGETVLSDAAKKKYFAPHVREGEDPSHYGYGWAIFRTSRGTRRIAHNGGDLGVFNADFHRYVDEDVVLIIATNADTFKAEFVSRPITAIIFGEEYITPPRLADIPPAALARLTGTYVLPSGGRFEARVSDGRLVLTPQGRDALSLLVSREGERADTAALSELDERVSTILDSSSQANYRPMHEALAGGISLEQVTAMASRAWDEWRSLHGAFEGFEVLGSVAARLGDIATYARLDFESGQVLMRYLWAEGRLDGIRPLQSIPGSSFVAESESRFASFTLAPPLLNRLIVERDSRGNVSAFTFETPEGKIRATRGGS